MTAAKGKDVVFDSSSVIAEMAWLKMPL